MVNLVDLEDVLLDLVTEVMRLGLPHSKVGAVQDMLTKVLPAVAEAREKKGATR
jgi:hypothetical protein